MDLARNLIQPDQRGRLADPHGGRPARHSPWWTAPGRWTYGEFNALGQPARARARRPAATRGVTRSALASGNSAEFLAVYYACAKLGVVCVPMNLGWRADEVAYVLGHSRARGLVAETQLVASMRRAIGEGADLADVIVRARPRRRLRGRTRRPPLDHLTEPGRARPPRAGVLRGRPRPDQLPVHLRHHRRSPRAWSASHVAIYLESMSRRARLGWRPDDRFAAMMPLFHTAQLNAFCTPAVMVGATIHLLRGFDPAALLDLIERERITQIFGLPMMYRAMLDHPSSPAAICPACAARSTRWRRCRTN